MANDRDGHGEHDVRSVKRGGLDSRTSPPAANRRLLASSCSFVSLGPQRATATACIEGYDSLAKSPAWSMAQSWNECAGVPVTSNTVEVTSAG